MSEPLLIQIDDVVREATPEEEASLLAMEAEAPTPGPGRP